MLPASLGLSVIQINIEWIWDVRPCQATQDRGKARLRQRGLFSTAGGLSVPLGEGSGKVLSHKTNAQSLYGSRCAPSFETSSSRPGWGLAPKPPMTEKRGLHFITSCRYLNALIRRISSDLPSMIRISLSFITKPAGGTNTKFSGTSSLMAMT